MSDLGKTSSRFPLISHSPTTEPHAETYVLDDLLQPVLIGVVGERTNASGNQ